MNFDLWTSPSFQVYPSSVGNQKDVGNGLYALRRFKKGEKLGLCYPGVHTTYERFVELNEIMLSLTRCKTISTDHVLNLLKRDWDITIVPPPSRSTVQYPPNWDVIYDNFVNYRIETTYYNMYNWDGSIHADHKQSRSFALFINEASSFDSVVNCLTLNVQLSHYNVYCNMDKRGIIHFYAARDIEVGDELWLWYGDNVNRNYKCLTDDTWKEGVFCSDFIVKEVSFSESTHSSQHNTH